MLAVTGELFAESTDLAGRCRVGGSGTATLGLFTLLHHLIRCKESTPNRAISSSPETRRMAKDAKTSHRCEILIPAHALRRCKNLAPFFTRQAFFGGRGSPRRFIARRQVGMTCYSSRVEQECAPLPEWKRD